MRTLELQRNGNISIIGIIYDKEDYYKEFAVVFNYDKTKHFGEQWTSGTYFINLLSAVSYYYEKINGISHYRIDEIATQALHFIEDIKGELNEFNLEYNIDLNKDELLYFGLDNYL